MSLSDGLLFCFSSDPFCFACMACFLAQHHLPSKQTSLLFAPYSFHFYLFVSCIFRSSFTDLILNFSCTSLLVSMSTGSHFCIKDKAFVFVDSAYGENSLYHRDIHDELVIFLYYTNSF